MTVLYLILLLLAAVCFAVAGFTGRSTVDRNGVRSTSINLVAVGLFFWVLVPLIQTIRAL